MAITYNGVCVNGTYSGVSTSGAITFAIGGVLHTGDCMLVATIAHDAQNTTANPITSITDSAGNTWQKYTAQAANSGWHLADTNSGTQRWFSVEIWYAKNATCNTSIDLTVNHANAVDAAVISLSSKILGYNATQPWDQNASLPKTLTVNAAAAAQTVTGISTNTADVAGYWALGCFSGSIGTSNPTFNGAAKSDGVQVQKNNTEFVKGQNALGVPVASAYSGVTYSSPTSADNMFIICAALTADSQVNLAARPYAALIG